MKNHIHTYLIMIAIAGASSAITACNQTTAFSSQAQDLSSSVSPTPPGCDTLTFGTVCNGTPPVNTPPGAQVTFYQLTPISDPAGTAATMGQYVGQTVSGSMNLFTSQSKVSGLTGYATSINVPDQTWTLGFPGYPNLQEWFGLCYDGTWTAPASGSYTFVTAVDDAVAIWIDGQLIGENNGGTVSATVQTDTGNPFNPNPVALPAANLTAGAHQVEIMYYQGWPAGLEVQIWALPPGQSYTAGTTPAMGNILQLSSPANGAQSCPH